MEKWKDFSNSWNGRIGIGMSSLPQVIYGLNTFSTKIPMIFAGQNKTS